MNRKHLFAKSFTTFLSLIYFLTNCAYLHATETNFWHERRAGQSKLASHTSDRLLASLPMGFSLPASMPVLSMQLNSGLRKLNSDKSIPFPISHLVKNLPVQFGTVRSVQIPQNADGRVVVYIQDVHLNAEAQANIGKTLAHLLRNSNPRLLALEGSFGPIDLSRFYDFKNQEIIRKTANHLLRRNDISGPIHSAITQGNKSLLIIGVDSKSHHAANIQAYRSSLKRWPQVKESLDRATASVNQSKNLTFNPTLLAFDKGVSAYRTGQMSLSAYLTLLSNRLEFISTEVELFVEALKTEESLDFQRVENERNQLLSRLVPSLDETEKGSLVNLSVSYKLGQASNAHFYSELKNICSRHGLPLNQYSALYSYVQYVLLSEGINVEKLFRDVRIMEDQTYAKLAETETEKNLISQDRILNLSTKLIDFSLTRDEWLDYKSDRSHQIPSIGVITGLESFEAFYKEAEIRDQEMAQNFLAQRENEVAVLVTGGFHSTGVTERLLKSGRAVVTFSPRLTQAETRSGVEALGLFAQEKTPLEKIFSGEKLFLSQNPAQLGRAPFVAAAIQEHMNPGQKEENIVAALALPNLPIPSVNVTLRGDQVVEKITAQDIAGNNQRLSNEYVLNSQHEIISEKETVLTRFAPELLLGFLVYSLSQVVSFAPGTLWGVALLGPVVVRFFWMFSIFVHGSGHVFGQFSDQINRVRLAHLFEGTTLREFFGSLKPLSPIYTPGFSKQHKALPLGDQGHLRTRFKASLGIAMNFLAIYVLSYPALHFSSFDPTGFLLTASIAFMATNILFALTSLTDVVSMVTGLATQLACGNIFINALMEKEAKKLFPDRLKQLIGFMGIETAVRGRQAGGGLIFGKDQDNQVQFVGFKGVNAKRGDLTKITLRKIDQEAHASEVAGFKPLETFTGFFHWRFGTSSPPSVLETHWHEWTPIRKTMQWSFDAAGQLVKTGKALNIRIGHNGDFDGFESNSFLGAFGKVLGVGDVGDSMRRFLWTNETQGDSPKIAGVMDILMTQGMWDASARLAYLLQISPTFQNAFKELIPSQKELVSRKDVDGGTLQSERDMSIAPAVGEMVGRWGVVLEKAFEKNKKELYLPGVKNLAELNREALPKFIADAIKGMNQEPTMKSWPDTKKTAFIESALFVFANNNLENAMKMFFTMPQKTSTFGLGVVSTLEPESTYVAAKGQPLTVGYSPKEKFYATASEPAAVLSTLRDDPEARIFDLDDDGGEIVKVNPKSGITVYSMVHRRYLSEQEIEDRWVPVQANPYIHIPRIPEQGEDLVKQDLDETASVLSTLYADFNNPQSWNSKTAHRFSQGLIDKIEKNGRGKKPEEVDFVLIAEEKSRQVAYRFANDLRSIFPTLKICVVSSNRYLKNQSKLYKNGIIGPDTLMMAISQSGQTFSSLKATRHAARQVENVTYQELRAVENLDEDNDPVDPEGLLDAVKQASTKKGEGKLKDIFVMSGEWHSKMGKALGQNFKPDSPFGERIFCNQSMRRRAEASTIATVAADYALTQLLIYSARAVQSRYPGQEPYSMKISKEDIEQLERESKEMVEVHIPRLTGKDQNNQHIYNSIVVSAHRWADHTLEPLTALILTILFIVITVSTGWTPLTVVSTAFSNLGGIPLSPWLVRSLDALVYASLFWTIPYGLRWLQGRTILARTGTRSLVIVSPMWKLLRNYVERLWGEGWGHLTPFVDGRKAEDLVNDKASSVVRGTLLFGQMDDSALSAEGQLQEVAATKMALSQSDGIRTFDVGPDITLMQFDPKNKTKFKSIALRDEQTEMHRPHENLSKDAHELITSRFRNLEMLVAGQVFFWAMSDRTARFQVKFFKERSQSLLQGGLALIFGLVNWVFSKSFVLLYSTVSRWMTGTEKTDRLFVVGSTQSGTTIATTQTTPDRSSEALTTSERDIESIAGQLQRYSNLPGNLWIPQSGNSLIPFFLAHLSEPLQYFPALEAIRGGQKEGVVESLRIDSRTEWHVYDEGLEKTIVIPAGQASDILGLTENPTDKEMLIEFNNPNILRILNHGTVGIKTVRIPFNSVDKIHRRTTPTGTLEVENIGSEGIRIHISGEYSFEISKTLADGTIKSLRVNSLYLLNPPGEKPSNIHENIAPLDSPSIRSKSSSLTQTLFRVFSWAVQTSLLLGLSGGFALAATQLHFWDSSNILVAFFGRVVLPLVAMTLAGRTFVHMGALTPIGRWGAPIFSNMGKGILDFPIIGSLAWVGKKLVKLFFEFGFQPIDRLVMISLGDDVAHPSAIERVYRSLTFPILQLPFLPVFATLVFVQKRLTLLAYYAVGLALMVVVTMGVLQWVDPTAIFISLQQIMSWNVVAALDMNLSFLDPTMASAIVHVLTPWAFVSALVLALLLVGGARLLGLIRGRSAPKQNFIKTLILTALVLHLIPMDIALIKLILVQGFGLPWLFEIVDGQEGVLGIGNRIIAALGLNPMQLITGVSGLALVPIPMEPERNLETPVEITQEPSHPKTIELKSVELTKLTDQLDALDIEAKQRLAVEEGITKIKIEAKERVASYETKLRLAKEQVDSTEWKKKFQSLENQEQMILKERIRIAKEANSLPEKLRADPKFETSLDPWTQATIKYGHVERDSTRNHVAWRDSQKMTDGYTKLLKDVGAAHEAGNKIWSPRLGDSYEPLSERDLLSIKPIGEFSNAEIKSAGAKFSGDRTKVIVPVTPVRPDGNGWSTTAVHVPATDLAMIDPETGRLMPVKLGNKGWSLYEEQRLNHQAEMKAKQSPDWKALKEKDANLKNELLEIKVKQDMINKELTRAQEALSLAINNLKVLQEQELKMRNEEAPAPSKEILNKMDELRHKIKSTEKEIEGLKEKNSDVLSGELKNSPPQSQSEAPPKKAASAFWLGLFGGGLLPKKNEPTDEELINQVINVLEILNKDYGRGNFSKDAANRLNILLAGTSLSLELTQTKFSSTASSRRDFLNYLHSRISDASFLARLSQEIHSRSIHLDVKKARWILEQMATIGINDPLANNFPAGQAEPGSLLVLTLRRANMPTDLRSYFKIVARFNTDSDGKPLGEVICLVDDVTLLEQAQNLSHKVPGVRLAMNRTLFASPESQEPVKLNMAELQRSVLEILPNTEFSKTRIIAPAGIDRDFNSVPLDSPLREATIIFLNEQLGAMEVDRNLQNKLNEMAQSLVQA